MAKIVVTLSGGADSVAVMLKAALEKHVVYPVFVHYGQQSVVKELKSAKFAVEWAQDNDYKVKNLVIIKLPLGSVSPCRAIDGKAPEKGDVSYIPARNSFICLAAVEYALELNAPEVWVGFTKAYPNEKRQPMKDQTQAFLDKFNQLIPLAFEDKKYPIVVADRIDMTKTDNIRLLYTKGYPLDKLWTCYTKGKACGRCNSCKELARAMAEVKY